MFELAAIIVCPAQLSVMPFTPMTSPFPEQGPMSLVKVMLPVIVAPHPTEAMAGAGRRTSAQPVTVTSSRTASGTFEVAFSLKANPVGDSRDIYGFGRGLEFFQMEDSRWL